MHIIYSDNITQKNTYLKPSFVHIMIDGNIIKTGNYDLITKLEKKGYSNF